MSSQRLISLLVTALLLMAASVYGLLQSQSAVGVGQPLLNTFQGADVAVVTVESDGVARTFLKDKTDRWALLEENGAFVADGYVEAFVSRLGALKKDVPATRLPEFYVEEKVDDASACAVSLMDADGGVLASLFIGKPFSDKDGAGFFVRRPDDKQSWRTYSDTGLCLKVPDSLED